MTKENELVVIPPETAMTIFTTEKALDPFLARIRGEIDKFTPDMTTAAGRKEIASMAFKIARSKTYLDGVGKTLADEAKAIPKKIDASRKLVRDTLDAWRDEVRAPLDEFEAKEEARVQAHRDAIDWINECAQGASERTAAVLRVDLEEVESVEIGPKCEEFIAGYAAAKDAAVKRLKAAIAVREKHEAEQEELARLRKEADKRAARDREEKLARDAADAARREAEGKAAAELARVEATAKAERDAAEKRDLEAKLAVEKAERRAAEAEANAKREADAERQREADAAKAREADKANRIAVNRAALDALMQKGIDEKTGKTVIRLIAANEIPRVSIAY